MLETGESFVLFRGVDSILSGRKRDKKAQKKEDNKEATGIDVTSLAKQHKNKKGRWLTIDLETTKECKFVSNDKAGRSYSCFHCSKELHRVGKDSLIIV